MNQQIEGQIRHVLTLLAGILVTFGLLSEDIVSEAVEILMTGVGFVLGLIGFVRSWIKKPDEPTIQEVVKTTVEELKA